METVFGGKIERSYPIGDGGEVEVHCVSGSIKIRGGEPGVARLVASFDDEGTLGIEQDERRLVVRPTPEDGACDVDFELTVPRGCHVIAGTVDGDIDVRDTRGVVHLHTVNGDIEASGLESAGDAPLSIETGDGDIKLTDAQGTISLATSSGDLTVERCSGELSATSHSGDINVSIFSGVLNAQNTNGEVSVARSALRKFHINNTNGEVRVETPLTPGEQYYARSVNGEIILSAPAGSSFTAQLRTVNGDVACDLPHEIINGSKRNRQVRVGGGGATVNLETTNGDVRIRRGSGEAPAVSEPTPSTNWTPIPPIPPTPRAPVTPPAPVARPAPPAPRVEPFDRPEGNANAHGDIGVSDQDSHASAADEVPEGSSANEDGTLSILARLEEGEITVDEALERLEALR